MGIGALVVLGLIKRKVGFAPTFHQVPPGAVITKLTNYAYPGSFVPGLEKLSHYRVTRHLIYYQ